MILFQIFFVVLCVDFSLNGPGNVLLPANTQRSTRQSQEQPRDGIAKKFAIIILPIALVSVVMDNLVLYIVCLIVMLAVCLIELYKEHVGGAGAQQQQQHQLLGVGADEELSVVPDQGRVPDTVHALLTECIDAFERNLDPQTNYLGKEWKLVVDEPAIKIYQSSFPGQSCKWWKVETTVQASLDTFVKEVLDIDRRCHWDPSLRSGKILHEYTPDAPRFKSDDRVTLSQYFTEAAAGGAVSSRELVNLGLLRWGDDNKTVTYLNTSFDPKIAKDLQKNSPIATREAVRGESFPGGGMRAELDEKNPGCLNFVMVNAIDLKGWLLAKVVNSATSEALLDTTRLMRAHLAGKD